MAKSERRKRGEEMIKKVYAGDVIVPPEGAMPFTDIMLEQLFAEVWTREELSMRDRRLLLLERHGHFLQRAQRGRLLEPGRRVRG